MNKLINLIRLQMIQMIKLFVWLVSFVMAADDHAGEITTLKIIVDSIIKLLDVASFWALQLNTRFTADLILNEKTDDVSAPKNNDLQRRSSL